MSLILEALKKSEAERQLGRVPGLMTPMPASIRSGWQPRLMLVFVALAAAGGAGTAMWLFVRPVAPYASVPRAPAIIETPELASARPDGSAKIEPAAAASPQQVIAARTGAAESAKAEGATDRSVTRAPIPLPQDPLFDSVERESVAQVPADLQPTAVHGDKNASVTPNSPSAPPLASAEPTLTATAAVAPPRPVAPSEPDLPGLAQLDEVQRNALPPLKLSMHVYADTPADRFVLIDGRRYGEGASLAASLQVIEVRRDGVVLDFNGTRFMLRRP